MSLNLYEVVDGDELDEMIAARYVTERAHPDDPNLRILNYTASCQYDRAWNDTTRACRGLIYRHVPDVGFGLNWVVARPWPKFFNHGELDESLDLSAPVAVTDKLDGSLGILYPHPKGGLAIATRGSFASEQALHATDLLRARYSDWTINGWTEWTMQQTWLFEIVFPDNRIVCDYGDLDDLILLDVLGTRDGQSDLHLIGGADDRNGWPGPRAERFDAPTLADALAIPPRPNAEGVVVRFQDGRMVKVKQDDYVALHRILTGTNARHVWEYAAVWACHDIVREPKHWATYLGIDPARAAELIAVGSAAIFEKVPDEFRQWLNDVLDEAEQAVDSVLDRMSDVVEVAIRIEDARERFEYVTDNAGVFTEAILRICRHDRDEDWERLKLRAWRSVTPEPTMPFARSEDAA